MLSMSVKILFWTVPMIIIEASGYASFSLYIKDQKEINTLLKVYTVGNELAQLLFQWALIDNALRWVLLIYVHKFFRLTRRAEIPCYLTAFTLSGVHTMATVFYLVALTNSSIGAKLFLESLITYSCTYMGTTVVLISVYAYSSVFFYRYYSNLLMQKEPGFDPKGTREQFRNQISRLRLFFVVLILVLILRQIPQTMTLVLILMQQKTTSAIKYTT